MGSWGAIIMGFFGAVFAIATLNWQWHISGWLLALPVAVALAIWLAAACVIRLPGEGLSLSPEAARAIRWSSIGEGIAIPIAMIVIANTGHPELALPAIALIVGPHFLPIARAARFTPYYLLGGLLLVAAAIGFILHAPLGGQVTGIMAAACLWFASALAVVRDWRVKTRRG